MPRPCDKDAAALEQASPTFGERSATRRDLQGLAVQAGGQAAQDHGHRRRADPGGRHHQGPRYALPLGGTVAQQLSSGVPGTWDGDGHTAYGRANKCLTHTVDAYFVDGKVPADRTTLLRPDPSAVLPGGE